MKLLKSTWRKIQGMIVREQNKLTKEGVESGSPTGKLPMQLLVS